MSLSPPKKYWLPSRTFFDPKNQEHKLDYAYYIKYNTWQEGCKYYLEEGYQDIPSMINAKLAKEYLNFYIQEAM